jgi:hypothetical protein
MIREMQEMGEEWDLTKDDMDEVFGFEGLEPSEWRTSSRGMDTSE